MKSSFSLITLSRFTIEYLEEILSSNKFDETTKGLAKRVLAVKRNP